MIILENGPLCAFLVMAFPVHSTSFPLGSSSEKKRNKKTRASNCDSHFHSWFDELYVLRTDIPFTGDWALKSFSFFLQFKSFQGDSFNATNYRASLHQAIDAWCDVIDFATVGNASMSSTHPPRCKPLLRRAYVNDNRSFALKSKCYLTPYLPKNVYCYCSML